jgi:adenine-specific DNA-methyltransferase
MNKQSLISKIKQLEGISQDERAYLIELVNTKKKYGLVWEDKPEEVEEQLRENLPVLKEVKEKAIINGEEHPNHILIEGDNLHALTALTFTHEGKIDVIYIDPPYNTGNKDFYYNDDYVFKEDGYRHSKWLSYMNKRLRIAKKLLNEDGLIFISIDDNEQSQLKMLCDEIFFEKNFINCICQKSRHSVSNDLIISENHNFLLLYAKNFQNVFNRRKEFRITKEINPSLFKNPDNDPKGPYKIHPVDGPGGAKKGNPHYEFKGITGFWRYSEKTMQQYYDDGEIVVRKNTLGRKYYLSKALENNVEAVTTWWDDVGTTTDGTKLLKDIIYDCDFNNPKPIGLLNKILSLSTNKEKEFKILDFFAGSGTTLHATMALNAENGGNRQCILVTNNENNICEEVTYERNKRVIEGYINSKGVAVEGLSNNNLRYYKSEFASRQQNLKNKKELTYLATELLCIKEDCYSDVTANFSADKKQNWLKVFANHKSQMVVIYDDAMIEESIAIIQEVNKQKFNTEKIKVYVFSNGQYPYTEDFEDVLSLITLCALPDAIYKAYQHVLPKKERKEVPVLEEDLENETEGDLFNQGQ